MVQASYDDVTSLERAMEGSHGVFAVTNFDELLDPVKEEQQVRTNRLERELSRPSG